MTCTDASPSSPPGRMGALFDLRPQAWFPATRRVVANRIIAAYDPHLTRRQIAANAGASYAYVVQTLIAQKLTATRISKLSQLSKDEALTAIRGGDSVRRVAQRCGCSRQRIAKIVLEHERRTGQMVYLRHRGVAPEPRIHQTCSGGCGTHREITQAKLGRPWRCRVCAGHARRKRIPDITSVVNRRLSGKPWVHIAASYGYKCNCTGNFLRIVLRQLLIERRPDLITLLWPAGIPKWLRRQCGAST